MALSDFYPPAPDPDAQPSAPPDQNPNLRTIYQPPAAAPSAPDQPPAKKPITSTSFTRIGSTEHGDSVPYDMGSPDFPGISIGDAGKVPGQLANVVTGNADVLHPDIGSLNMPGLGLNFSDPKNWGKAAAITAEMALNRDPVALARVIKEHVPDATIEYDDPNSPQKQLTVQVPGGPKMYVDRPGFTPQKALYYGGQGAASIPFAGASLIAQGLRQGGQYALSHLGSWGLGGADQPVDPVGTGVATALPIGLGGIGAGILRGADWLTSEASTTADAVAARARNLYRWGFGAKEGDLTQNPAQLTEEDNAANAGSDAARKTMADFHNNNASINQDNKKLIVGQLSGDLPPDATSAPAGYLPNEGGFGEVLAANIRNKAKDLSDNATNAWAKLGPVSPSTAAGRSVTFSPDVSADVLSQGADTIRKFYGAPQGPNGAYTAAQLGEGGQAAVNALGQLRYGMMDAKGGLQSFNLGTLQDMRQQLQTVINDNQGKSASYAAISMKKALDDAITAAETNGRMSGDAGALADFRAANAATRARELFIRPSDNPAAAAYVDKVLNQPGYSGQQAVGDLFGNGGVVTPGGGTNAIITHLQSNMGDDAASPLRGALGMRSMYGNRGTSEMAEGPTGKVSFDYGSTADRIAAQAGGNNATGQLVFTPAMRDQLNDYAGALRVLSASNTPGMPRLNAPGSGYLSLIAGELPFGIGRTIDKLKSGAAAKGAIDSGGEIVDKAVKGATTPEGLGISIPKQTAPWLQDPRNPSLNWQRGAWRTGTPAYVGGGLLGTPAIAPPSATEIPQ